jgi:hypothetical protein
VGQGQIGHGRQTGITGDIFHREHRDKIVVTPLFLYILL